MLGNYTLKLVVYIHWNAYSVGRMAVKLVKMSADKKRGEAGKSATPVGLLGLIHEK